MDFESFMRWALPEVGLRILASEAEAHMIDRAERAVYPASSLRELPEHWRSRMFESEDDNWKLRRDLREDVRFVRGDIRDGPPCEARNHFDVIACRYLACTYFDRAEQTAFLERMLPVLRPGGILVIGLDEDAPTSSLPLRAEDESGSIYAYIEV